MGTDRAVRRLLGAETPARRGFSRIACAQIGGPGGEEVRHRKFTRRRVEQGRAGIELAEPPTQRREPFGALGEIAFRNDQPVGDRDLSSRLCASGERRFAIDRIDQRDDRCEREPLGQRRISGERMKDRRGIGEAGRLDHDAVERFDPARIASRQQPLQRLDEIAAQRAAEAA